MEKAKKENSTVCSVSISYIILIHSNEEEVLSKKILGEYLKNNNIRIISVVISNFNCHYHQQSIRS